MANSDWFSGGQCSCTAEILDARRSSEGWVIAQPKFGTNNRHYSPVASHWRKEGVMMLGWKRNDGWKKNLLGLVMLVLAACFLFGVMEAQQGGKVERERVGQKEGRGRFPELMERFDQRFPSDFPSSHLTHAKDFLVLDFVQDSQDSQDSKARMWNWSGSQVGQFMMSLLRTIMLIVLQVLVGKLLMPDSAVGIYVSGNYAYVADRFAGLRVIDVSNPSNPREYAYVADGGAGLIILRFTGAQPVNRPPSVPVLLSPANNATVSPVPAFKLKSDDPDNDQVMFIMEVKQGGILKSFQTGFYSSGVEVTYSDSKQPLSDGQWQWRAKARDKRGAESGWSEWKTFTVQSNLPDLVPIDLKVTPDTAKPGSDVIVSFKVLNQGRKRANASKTRIILSKSASEPSSSDPLLKELSTPALDPNKSQDYSQSVTIPADIQTGDYYVWVVVDVDKTSGQGDDTNDKAKFPIKVQEKLDYDVLVVEEVVRKEGGKEIIEEKPVAVARIIVFDENHNIITEGTTNREGKAKIPALKVGHYIRAEKYITTFYLNDKNEAVEQKTNRKFYDVYLTSDEVENSGFIFNEVKALPVKLVIRKHNALIKFHLELAFEWDADAKTRDFWIAALRHASNLLYDATDGHVCIGSVKVLNNYRYPTPYGEYTGVPRNAIQVFADNDIRPYVWGLGMYGVHIGRMWVSEIGDWRTIQPELLGSVLAHEFGHCLLLLDDEYDYETNDPKCVEPEIDQKDEYGHFNDSESKIAYLMAAPWDADKSRKVSSYSSGGISFGEGWWKVSELCSEVPGRHTYKNRLFMEIKVVGKFLRRISVIKREDGFCALLLTESLKLTERINVFLVLFLSEAIQKVVKEG